MTRGRYQPMCGRDFTRLTRYWDITESMSYMARRGYASRDHAVGVRVLA